MGLGQVGAAKQAVDGNDPHGGHGCVGVGDTVLFRGVGGEPLVGRDQTIFYQVAVSFP
jgi:hypothetical protein